MRRGCQEGPAGTRTCPLGPFPKTSKHQELRTRTCWHRVHHPSRGASRTPRQERRGGRWQRDGVWAGGRHLLPLPSDPGQDNGFHGQWVVLPVSESCSPPPPTAPHTPPQLAACLGTGVSEASEGSGGGREGKAAVCPIKALKNWDLNNLLWPGRSHMLRALWVQSALS